MTDRAVLRVGAGEANVDDALEELVELQTIVAVLGRLASDNATIGGRDLERVVHLIGAFEDVDHAGHRELVRR